MLAEQALAEARAAAHQAKLRRDEAVRARRQFEDQLESRRARGMPAWQWMVTYELDQRLMQEEQAAVAALAEAQVAVNARLQELVAARRREEVLKRLRQRRWEAYRWEFERADQAETDEMARNVVWRRKEVG
ncbi:MAG TPA: flagellar FliJ family protein [Symbiobacteriaceae bacterium]